MASTVTQNNALDNSVYDYTFHLIDPKKKDAKWALDYIKVLYPQLTSYFSSPYWNGRFDYATIRAYGRGQQPVQIYKDQFNPQGYAASRAGGSGAANDWTGMRWNIPNPIPKYKNIVTAGLKRYLLKYNVRR